MLSGETQTQQPTGPVERRPFVSLIIVGVALFGALCSLVAGFFVSGHEAKAGSFFGAGALFLTAALAGVWAAMRVARGTGAVRGAFAIVKLGIRNAARHPARSLLTVSLLASATFLLVAVQCFHREAGEEFAKKDGGSGGFNLYAQCDVPVFQNLQVDLRQTKSELIGRYDSLLAQDPDLRLGEGIKKRQALVDKAQATLKQAEIFALRVREGDDASCLNLYQPLQPRILGVPERFIDRGGFEFAAIKENGLTKEENPWRLLDAKEGDAIPVFADANSAKYILKIPLGGNLEVTDGNGLKRKLVIVGLLQASIFQSELLMSESNFEKLFPRLEGYQFFLIDAPSDEQQDVASLLASILSDHGFEATPTRNRIQRYLEVENTYLATFQLLGALGLLLGALGLAVVLLRSVWERRGELALLRALGLRRNMLGRLVLAENAFLLILGLAIGTIAALFSVAPHVLDQGTSVPWSELLLLLALVLAVGLIAGIAAIAATLRAPLLPALRRD